MTKLSEKLSALAKAASDVAKLEKRNKAAVEPLSKAATDLSVAGKGTLAVLAKELNARVETLTKGLAADADVAPDAPGVAEALALADVIGKMAEADVRKGTLGSGLRELADEALSLASKADSMESPDAETSTALKAFATKAQKLAEMPVAAGQAGNTVEAEMSALKSENAAMKEKLEKLAKSADGGKPEGEPEKKPDPAAKPTEAWHQGDLNAKK